MPTGVTDPFVMAQTHGLPEADLWWDWLAAAAFVYTVIPTCGTVRARS